MSGMLISGGSPGGRSVYGSSEKFPPGTNSDGGDSKLGIVLGMQIPRRFVQRHCLIGDLWRHPTKE